MYFILFIVKFNLWINYSLILLHFNVFYFIYCKETNFV